MGVLYITSQNDGVGKTTLTAALVGILKDSGKKAIGLIPSREGDLVDTERDILSRLLGEEIGGPSYSSKDTLISAIVDAGAKSAFVIVEGPGTVDQADHIDIVSKTEAKAIVVSDFTDGDSCLEFARNFGSDLAGVVINCRTKYGRTEMANKLTPVFEEAGIPILGVIPEDRTLLSLTVGQISENLGGNFFCGEHRSDRLVEHFMIGGFGMDPGQYVFSTRNKKAVVVRGDRPDVQMSALQTDMECFIMTNGLEPIEYVKYESDEEDVAVIIVETNTLETMDRLASLQKLARFDHPEKLERAKILVSENVCVETLADPEQI